MQNGRLGCSRLLDGCRCWSQASPVCRSVVGCTPQLSQFSFCWTPLVHPLFESQSRIVGVTFHSLPPSHPADTPTHMPALHQLHVVRGGAPGLDRRSSLSYRCSEKMRHLIVEQLHIDTAHSGCSSGEQCSDKLVGHSWHAVPGSDTAINKIESHRVPRM